MILDELVLHNFGLYRGRQIVDLSPKKATRPVILVGALNGGGKTTFLDALRLVLYGRRAITSNRQDQAYDDYLQACIHRGVSSTEGAALEIAFRMYSDGTEQLYRVHRSWTVKNKTLRERVEVTVNGLFEPALTESWAERVEEILPLKLSQFFFFDGEKLEALADIERSREVLREAIHALLGLDLVDQLTTDLKILERRQREQLLTADARTDIGPLKAELERADSEVQRLLLGRGEQSNLVSRSKADLKKAERQYAQDGGPLRERLTTLTSERAHNAKLLQDYKAQLTEIAEGATPLLLVKKHIDALMVGGDAAISADALVAVLDERDAQILAALTTAGDLGAAHLKILAKVLEADRRQRKATARKAASLPGIGRSSGHAVLTELGNVEGKVRATLDAFRKVTTRLLGIDRELAQVPAEDAIQASRDNLQACEKQLFRAEAALHAADEILERARAIRERAMTSYSNALEKDVDRQQQGDVNARLTERAAEIRDVLAIFRQRVAERHAQRIAALIAESFQHLHRKSGVVERIEIDPVTFGMMIFGHDHQPLPPERLSAGERQLLAVATIWAILKASGRPLPLVIDTPLGRLDSEHRQFFVERFLPRASHQTILLSTDTEIDTRELARLKPYIGHSYIIEYDAASRSSTIENGYFWETAA